MMCGHGDADPLVRDDGQRGKIGKVCAGMHRAPMAPSRQSRRSSERGGFRQTLLALMAALAFAGCGEREDGSVDIAQGPQVAQGAQLYARHCAGCHGARLEGQPDWRQRRADGKLPAPPHDDSGHTWHHPSEQLFRITKYGLQPPDAPAGYASDMPGFAGALSDEEIRAVLAYIESRWSSKVRQARAERLR